jgi:hypothetical protein
VTGMVDHRGGVSVAGLPASAEVPAEAAVRAFVYDWYRLLDEHAPVEQYLPLLSDDVELVLPEVTLTGPEAFAAWYRGGSETFSSLPGVVNVFFDEVHELKRVDISLDDGAPGAGGHASVLVVVRWEAHRWTPPNARSDVLRFDAWQRWVLELSPQGRPLLRRYIVDKLEPLQGSGAL